MPIQTSNLILNNAHFNSFEYFYRKQIRKDLIDKLVVVSPSDVDLSCAVSYKAYFTALPSERNFKLMSAASLAYLYILESFFCQKVVRSCTIKKNLVQRDAAPTYFYSYLCTLRKNNVIFFLLQRLFVVLLYQSQKNRFFVRPTCKWVARSRSIFLKDLDLAYTPWTRVFPTLTKRLQALFEFKPSNAIVFFFLLSRLHLTRFLKSNLPAVVQDSRLGNPSFLVTEPLRTKNLFAQKRLFLKRSPFFRSTRSRSSLV